jgi:hypothetical protein
MHEQCYWHYLRCACSQAGVGLPFVQQTGLSNTSNYADAARTAHSIDTGLAVCAPCILKSPHPSVPLLLVRRHTAPQLPVYMPGEIMKGLTTVQATQVSYDHIQQKTIRSGGKAGAVSE